MKLYLCPIEMTETDLRNQSFPVEFLWLDKMTFGQLTRWLHHKKQDSNLLKETWNLVVLDNSSVDSVAALWLASEAPRWDELAPFVNDKTELCTFAPFQMKLEALPSDWPAPIVYEELDGL